MMIGTEKDEHEALRQELRQLKKALGKIEGHVDRLRLTVLFLSLILFMMSLRNLV